MIADRPRSIVRSNLMERKGYAPYCGKCDTWARARFNGEQFECRCGWKSKFEPEFIAEYKAKWEIDNLRGK